jgi:hypothetical protein
MNASSGLNLAYPFMFFGVDSSTGEFYDVLHGDLRWSSGISETVFKRLWVGVCTLIVSEINFLMS